MCSFLPFLLLRFDTAYPLMVLFAFTFCVQNSLKNLLQWSYVVLVSAYHGRHVLLHLFWVIVLLVCWCAGGPVGRQWPGRMAGWLPAGRQPACSFIVLWHGEAFHGLGVQGAEISAFPCALPQPIMSPVSQQGLWFPELTQSASVSQLPFWIWAIVTFKQLYKK
jgi:hypothetical protein